jgi:hypothetical protein
MLKYALTMATALTATAFGAPAFAGPASNMVGTWVNTDPSTRGITKLVITETGNTYEVHGFGKCSPNDCDLGKKPMTTYGSSISDTTHQFGTAIYNPGFSESTLTIEQSGGQIIVHDFTRFTDSSARQNYHARYTLQKVKYTPIIKKPDLPKTPLIKQGNPIFK